MHFGEFLCVSNATKKNLIILLVVFSLSLRFCSAIALLELFVRILLCSENRTNKHSDFKNTQPREQNSYPYFKRQRRDPELEVECDVNFPDKLLFMFQSKNKIIFTLRIGLLLKYTKPK